MSTTSRHICTLLAIGTKTQSHSQVWMCDPFAVRVWSRPSNALSRSVPAGYWGKMAGYQLFRPSCLLVIWVNGWSSAGSKGRLCTTGQLLRNRSVMRMVHVQTSVGWLLSKWPVISKGPRVVCWQPTFGYQQGCRTVLIGIWVTCWKNGRVISKGLRVVYSQPTFGALGYLVEMVGLFWVGYYVREVWCKSEERMGAKLWTGLKVHKGS